MGTYTCYEASSMQPIQTVEISFKGKNFKFNHRIRAQRTPTLPETRLDMNFRNYIQAKICIATQLTSAFLGTAYFLLLFLLFWQ